MTDVPLLFLNQPTMNLINTSTNSPRYVYRKRIGTTKENLNSDVNG